MGVGVGVPAACEGVADGERAGASIAVAHGVPDNSGASACHGVAQVRGLSGGDEVLWGDADTQWLVAAVLPYGPFGKFACEEQREPVG